MKRSRTLSMKRLYCILLFLTACGGAPHQIEPSAIAWQPWTADTFVRAAESNRYLLVSVQASWCHWCHVMNDATFGDPEVRRLLADRFVSIKVDSDARPDLAERFRDYAWPATVLLSPKAEVIVALRGYYGPEFFTRLLRRVNAGEVVADSIDELDTATEDLRALRDVGRVMLDQGYDHRMGGWGRTQKYPYFGPIEQAVFQGGPNRLNQVQQTLKGTAQLIDPVFGGAYQYSLKRRWDQPHFEKITAVQADVLAGFASYGLAVPEHREKMRTLMTQITRYLTEFMQAPSGAFYTSQDADLNHSVTGTEYYALGDTERRNLGIPRIDQAVYTDLNGRLIVALVSAYRAGHQQALPLALGAAQALAIRRQMHGGYTHTDESAGLFYLRDQAWMLRAELALYEATGQRRWRDAAVKTAGFTLSLKAPKVGFYAHTIDPAAIGIFAKRRIPLVENGVLARGLLHLGRLTGEASYLAAATHALQVGTTTTLHASGRRSGEYLMGLELLSMPYVKVLIVGPANDSKTNTMYHAGFQLATPYRIVARNTPAQSEYPYSGRAVAYLCNKSRCSKPVYDPAELAAAADAFLKQ